MAELTYQRMVIAYHGCDETVASGVLLGKEKLKGSENSYDWLGRGVYFWEHGPQRALNWARNSQKIKTPSVLGAYLNLGTCFDLLDTANTMLLGNLFPAFVQACEVANRPIPKNLPAKAGNPEDLILRHLDCAVVNWCLDFLEKEEGIHYHTVRCVFSEGTPAFDGSKIMAKSHIQIAVRDTVAIMGWFKPSVDNLLV